MFLLRVALYLEECLEFYLLFFSSGSVVKMLVKYIMIIWATKVGITDLWKRIVSITIIFRVCSDRGDRQ
jgi:hypothetical protein